MQTRISQQYLDTPSGKDADRILRNCVHCGFCTATCPTYQLLGDELDSPRGRIYLIKQVLEGEAVTRKTQLHLDRCLSCRSCETTCPSGVEYAHLLDIGREIVELKVRRPLHKQIQRFLLRKILTHPARFLLARKLMTLFNPILPRHLRMQSDTEPARTFIPARQHDRSVILLEGCVQPSLSPNINVATKIILDALGINIIPVAGIHCCGAISQHLSAREEALATMKNNIDAWWPHIENGCEAIISNATGCGITLKEYATYLRHDSAYAARAEEISSLARDISEMIRTDDVVKLKLKKSLKISFHAPCTLQHGLKLKDQTETLLEKLGFELCPVNDEHLCCGSAGTFSVLQPALAEQLKQNKLDNLSRDNPEYILSANIGCLHHLQSGTRIPVKHWTELVAFHL